MDSANSCQPFSIATLFVCLRRLTSLPFCKGESYQLPLCHCTHQVPIIAIPLLI